MFSLRDKQRVCANGIKECMYEGMIERLKEVELVLHTVLKFVVGNGMASGKG